MMHPLDSELHALVDGHLPDQRAAEVREWLLHNPEEAARVRAWQAQREALHALFDPVLEEPVPTRLQRSAMPGSWRRRMLPKIAAGIVWLAAGAVIGYAARSLEPGIVKGYAVATLPHQAAIAHIVYTPEVRHPVEVGAEQEAHLVQWLSKRLGSKIAVPNLNKEGYALVGGRLLPDEKGPAAQFMYQDGSGKRLTLYMRQNAANAGTAFRYASEGGIGVFYWVDGPFGYALSGMLPREKLLAAAEASYRQLQQQ
jgi:anti-sigma factor RsiW